jgi:YfiH family protein
MLKCITPDWPAPPQVKSCTTTRNFGSLVEEVNRKALIEELNLPSKPIWLKQVHGITNVRSEPDNLNCEADASFSNQCGSVCVIMTADCLPVLFCDKAGKQIAAAHAGWRGLAAGVLEETLKKFNVASPEDILVWLGPAIGPEKFEVGDEVRNAFIQHLPEAKQAFKAGNDGHYFADLYLLARQRLAAQGVNNVYGGNFCTYTDSDRFYSFRRNKITGRMASLIWLV